MANFINHKIGARGGNACHRSRPFSNWEIERLERYHRQNDESIIYTQVGKPVPLAKRKLRVNGKLVVVPRDKGQRSKFVELLKSGIDWYRAIDIISRQFVSAPRL